MQIMYQETRIPCFQSKRRNLVGPSVPVRSFQMLQTLAKIDFGDTIGREIHRYLC